MGRKQPTPREVSEAEAEAHIESTQSEDYGSRQVPDGVAFDYQVIDDENILQIFVDNPWLAPIRPNFSRLNFLTNMKPQQADLVRSRLERKIKRLKYSRKTREDKILLESLFDYFSDRINDSVDGWKLNVLATNRRILQLERLQKRRGWFGR